MALFYYKAADAAGEVVEGELEAADDGQAVARLQDRGLIPVRVQPAGGALGGLRRLRSSGKRVKGQHIRVFTQELSVLLKAGLPLDRALQILADLAPEEHVKSLVNNVLDRVRGGDPLSDALEAQGKTFSRFYVNMVRAGELSGSLDAVLKRLVEYLERMRELRESVVSALIYPAILLVVSVLSVFVLLTFVVPRFTALFEDAGRALPVSTQIVVAAGDFLRGYWWMIGLGIVAAVLLFRQILADPGRREAWDRFKLRLPVLGDLTSKLEAARFCRTLGTLLENGVPMLTALGIVRETISNRAMARALGVASDGLKEGRGMAGPLLEADLFPRLGLQMIRVGEETGHMEYTLGQVAELYDEEVRVAVKRMLSLLEPVLIIGLGLVIAFIIIAILTAILSVNELAF
ncbi:type II secretion system F family protein [Arhodomonas sp. AD133]|uniref:type II secretion system F family protein n=1 Tax=Arhodomonas sp. AD133 TaxID=3415009 RepID=UPI003EB91D35